MGIPLGHPGQPPQRGVTVPPHPHSQTLTSVGHSFNKSNCAETFSSVIQHSAARFSVLPNVWLKKRFKVGGWAYAGVHRAFVGKVSQRQASPLLHSRSISLRVHRFEDNFKFDATTQRDNFALAPAHTTWLAFPGPSGAPAYCA